MNYGQSQAILTEIKKANRIILNCHRGPDPDSIGSALAMKKVLENMRKEVVVICPSEKLYEVVSFLKGYNQIIKAVDFNTFRFSDFDLFICMDSSSFDMVTGSMDVGLPDLPCIVVDHHATNTDFGKINLVDKNASSVGEMMYKIFEDWNLDLDENVSTSLLTAIIGDTGLLRYPNTTASTFETLYQLIKNGANKDLIVSNLYRNSDYMLLKFWGENLKNKKINKKYKYVYVVLPYKTYVKYGKPDNAKDSAVDLFAQTTKGTRFGFMALETEPGKLSVSFRSRDGFDTSKIAEALGGGGHVAASGAKIEGMPYKEAIKKLLDVVNEYAKK